MGEIVNSLNYSNSNSVLRQRGFSLVELMVAMTLGIFLMGALVQILINGKQSFASANHLSRLQENGRVATNMITSDLKRAGYMGGNSNISEISGSEGQVPRAVSCPTSNTNWGRMVTEGVFGLDDTNAGYACIADADYLRGDVLAVRYASPWLSGPFNAFNADQLFLRSSLFAGRIFAGQDEAQIPVNEVTEQPQEIHDLVAHAYFIGNSGRNCNGQPVPSLFRVRLNGIGQPTSEELLPGVEHFQVQYGVGGQYVDANTVEASNNWDNVVTARFWLLVRSECADQGIGDTRTYNLGDQVYTPNDNYRRQLYSSVVLLRNQG
jgi:type IV pilus assembly protein PilW